MISLPPNLAHYFADANGHLDPQAVTRLPDDELLAAARRMAPEERQELYALLVNLQIGPLQRMMAQMVGFDADEQKTRFLRILEEASYVEAVPEPGIYPEMGVEPVGL